MWGGPAGKVEICGEVIGVFVVISILQIAAERFLVGKVIGRVM